MIKYLEKPFKFNNTEAEFETSKGDFIMKPYFQNIVFLFLCLLSVFITIFKPNSLITIFIFGALLCIYLSFFVKKYWHSERWLSLFCLILIILIIIFPLFLISL